jgi:hypothetical protein
MFIERREAKIGDCIEPDEWRFCEALLPGDEFTQEWKGCQFRVKTYNSAMVYPYGMPVNVITTGSPKFKSGSWVSRCKIEFVKDGEASEFTGGKLYHRE